MHKLRLLLLCGSLVPLALAFVSCGNGQRLQSISISPAAADAQNYPNGQVQYTATGIYTNGSKVKPLTALWTPGSPWSMTPLQPWTIPLDSNGAASCGSAPAGTYTIWAVAPIDPHFQLAKMDMNTPQVSGTAQLTCP